MIIENSSTKVAVIGCGAWGKNLFRNFYELGALSTFVESHSVAASQLENQYNISQQSLTEVMQDSSIAAVAVSVPSSQHFVVAKQALLAGKHLFIEKPVTLSLDQTTELIELAQARKRVFMTGHLPRYHPAFQKLKDMVDVGDIGKIGYIYSNRLNLGRIRTDENCLWDLAPHDLSLVLALVEDEVESIYTHGSTSIDKDILDTALVNLTFANGIKGHIFNSWHHPFKEHRLVVVGDTGILVFDDCNSWESKLVLYRHKIEQLDEYNFRTTPREAEPVKITPAEPLKVECEHFLSCIDQGKVPLTGPDEALRVMTVLDRIQSSLLESIQSTTNIKHAINE